jgi:hypothetical protein
MRGAISPLPQYVFMAWCSVKEKHKDNFTFYLPLHLLYDVHLELYIPEMLGIFFAEFLTFSHLTWNHNDQNMFFKVGVKLGVSP